MVLFAVLDEFQQLASIAGKARDFHIGIGTEYDAQALADELLVIGNHDLDFLRHKNFDASSFSGIMASRVKPRSLQ